MILTTMENRNTNFKKAFLTVDNTLLNKAQSIASKINLKYNRKDIDATDILIIYESQFKAITVGVKRGDAVKLPYIGKACIKPKRMRYLDEDVKETISKVHSVPNDLALIEVLNGISSY
jgi:hypothetical protein